MNSFASIRYEDYVPEIRKIQSRLCDAIIYLGNIKLQLHENNFQQDLQIQNMELKEKLIENSNALEVKKLEIRKLRARVIANDKGIKRLETIISSQQTTYHAFESKCETPFETIAIDGLA